jgi:CRISPR/Cas system-associated exonuclease Cas4 (RecB family)
VRPRDDIIRASELAQYAYCTRAWWLGRVKGYRSANVAAMRQGTVQHRTHGRAVESYHLLRRLAVALIVLAGVFLVAWLLLSLGG